MTRTGTQNRPYDETKQLMVRVTYEDMAGNTLNDMFDWNNRDRVRAFAAEADRAIRAGGTVTTRAVRGGE